MTQQQYTPVSWQDETTSQQGTLINAERLNQMQTAHHYADGLEEVDTVPTADPGVAYHKIVYCTADNTLYRWDGEAWTADIDDPTRELLEEHLADHDNPHQVTKSQVGLGNADNTSDADKPISTATQTALNAKADKSDTYTKAQVDTALALKADKATTYTKAETDTLLGGKADKATTLAGYGITDAYTKTEADTLLGTKADQATTYTKSEIDTALALKANDNAVVKLTGDQVVAGLKTFFCGTDNLPYIAHVLRNQPTVASSGLNRYAPISRITAGDGAVLGELRFGRNTSGATYLMTYFVDGDSTVRGSTVATMADIDGYLPMVRTTGNQAIGGVKDFTTQLMVTGIWDNKVSQNLESTSIWRRIYYTTTTSLSNQVLTLLVTPQKGNNDEAGIIVFYATTAGVSARWLVKGRGAVNDNYCIVKTSGGLYEVWAKNADGNRGLFFMRLNETNWGSTTNNWTRDLTTKDAAFDPTTYAGYAYPTEDGLAHTYGAETIAGEKTHTSRMIIKMPVNSIAQTIYTDAAYIGGSQNSPLIDLCPSSSQVSVGRLYSQQYGSDEGMVGMEVYTPTTGYKGGIYLRGDPSGAYAQTPTRGYNASYIDDVVTIGTLDAYTPMVRTTGNQTIMGVKTIQQVDARIRGYNIGTFSVGANKYYKLYEYAENCNFVLRLKGDQPNNNVGWIKVFLGGTAYYTRSVLLEKVSRYSTTYLYTCTNTTTNKDEIIFYTGSNVLGTVNIELTEGYMGSTFVSSFEETTDPNTDGNHTNIQRFG